MLFTVHLFMSKVVKNDLLELTKDESEQLATAVTRVTELYEIPLLSEKNMAWLNLGMVAGGIYGTRIMAAALKKKAAQKQVITMPFDIGGVDPVSQTN